MVLFLHQRTFSSRSCGSQPAAVYSSGSSHFLTSCYMVSELQIEAQSNGKVQQMPSVKVKLPGLILCAHLCTYSDMWSSY